MRDTLAVVLTLVGLCIGGVCLAALLRPMPRIWMATRKRALQVFGISMVMILAAIIIVPTQKEAREATPPAKIAKDAAPIAVHSAVPETDAAHLPPIERIMLPKGAPEAPVSGFCADQICEANRSVFSARYWPMAWKGDYQGQRNAAFCLKTGCDGAVKINAMAGCAWRLIILSAAHDEADDTDVKNLTVDCGNLDDAGRAAATARAKKMFKVIYGADMVSNH